MFTVENVVNSRECKKKATLMSFLQLTLLFYFKEEDVT